MQARKITLIEIGAGALPSITPVPVRQSSWFPTVYVSPDVPPVEGVVPNPVADGVLIEWDAVDQEGVIYIIERGATAEGPWMEIARVVETRYLYSDGSGQEWWFKITASVRGKPGEGAIIPVKPPPTAQEIIDLIAEQNRLGQEMAEGFAEQAEEIANLGAALNAAQFDPDVAYNPGAVTKWEGGLYYALVETTGNLPSDPTYWKKIGDYSSLAEAVGAQGLQLTGHEVRIEQTEDGLAIVSERVDGVAAALNGKADSSALNALSTRVSETEGDIEASATAITQANTAIAGKASAASVSALSNTVTEQGGKIDANALALNSVRSQLGGSGNLLRTTEFFGNNSMAPWATAAALGFWQRSDVILQDARVPPGMKAMAMYATPDNGVGNYLQTYQDVPCEGGKTYIASAYLLPYGLRANVSLVFINAAGSGVGTPSDSASATAYNPNGNLNGYTRVFAVGTAPAEAVRVRVSIWTSKLTPVGSDAALWALRPQLEQAKEGQTQPSPWQASSAGLDEKYTQVTQAIEARTTINENGIASYFASWTMSLDANGRVAGIRSVNNGTTSTIDFLFDRVRFVSPGTGRRMEYSDGHFLGYDENNVRRIRLGTWSA
ncbi:hypothetical protein PWP89_12945 [Stenotrophomonas rhizophila]|uniref:hypothetical protein n=1 Tax=Stenotrophomonas rhizophila TaxID=216778 RepID=UPI000B839730|nr:hypothetical protein [Stenotrophomonas rhizophila]